MDLRGIGWATVSGTMYFGSGTCDRSVDATGTSNDASVTGVAMADTNDLDDRWWIMNGGGSGYELDNVSYAIVPEPSSFALIAGSLLAFGLVAYRRRK